MVDLNVKKGCEYFGIGKNSVQSRRVVTAEELKSYKPDFKKMDRVIDEFVKVPKGQISDASIFKVKELKQIVKPTLATRMKRVPSVLMNILKHIK